jgi:hypothetical protein
LNTTRWLRGSTAPTWAFALYCVASVRLAWILIAFYVTGDARRLHLESAWFLFVAATIVTAWVRRQATDSPLEDSPAGGSLTLVGLGAVAVSVLLYWRAFRVGLLSDDYVLLTFLPGIDTDWQFFRPLPLLVWSAVHPLFGAAGLHAINVILHGVNATLVYRLSTTLLPSLPRASSLSAAALFLTFPAAVEPVLWNAGVFDVTLVTCSLLFVLSLAQSSARASVGGVVALIAALLCKETAVALCLLAWLVWFAGIGGFRRAAAATVICALYIGIRLTSTDAPATDAPLGYFLKEMLGRPFASLAVPWAADEVARSPILLAVLPQGLLASLWLMHARTPRASRRRMIFAAWILAAVAPLMSFFYVSEDLEGSRYLYLPLVGWALLLADLSGRQTKTAGRLIGAATISWLVISGTYGVFRHQNAWLRAADSRDDVLRRAALAATNSTCERAVFVGLPEAVGGAQLFRNGFIEAAATAGIRAAPAGDAAVASDCTFVWTGEDFRREDESAGVIR